MAFSKFDTMVTLEETFCEEWDLLCKADWFAAQEAMETDDAIAEANAEMVEELEEWGDDGDYYADPIDLYGAEWENHAVREWD